VAAKLVEVSNVRARIPTLQLKRATDLRTALVRARQGSLASRRCPRGR
jgi:hypothetical protein